MVYQAYTSSPNDFGASGGASYPGLGSPIGAYGMNPNGQPALGPYSFLQQGSNSQSTAYTPPTPNAADATATNFLNGVINGTNLPMGQEQQNAQYAQSSAMNAAAETQQNQAAQNAAVQGGASANDPSLQSQYRQNAAGRQGGNQRAMGQIQANAGSQNFGAQAGAAGDLLHHGESEDALAQQGSMFNRSLANSQSQQAMGYLNNFMSGSGGRQGVYNPATGWG